ncbi:Molybdenum cofactor guanylyltransferase [Dyadobacter sp. CECT 9623]|uniref:Molybdenum cofactor guanylyltransferase n=2 Tax=Dyadobacter linearis TaxID=2823330 RepID=A0ABM8ULK9_9BACT|nr:Molybdenum cofactor guanylyltransferase [Dyadobacter sp. CECT 9623]
MADTFNPAFGENGNQNTNSVCMGLIGIAVCGGKSSRMGRDKSSLIYHQKSQYEHVADLISGFCEKIIISCNQDQLSVLETEYEKMVDLPHYAHIGPIGALLTTFQSFPDHDFLFIGCDYPQLEETDISHFLNAIQEDSVAAAFYNSEQKYEPLLAWYAAKAGSRLSGHFESGDLSLQSFLRNVNAQKFLPEAENVMQSIDTPEDFARITELLKQKNNG